VKSQYLQSEAETLARSCDCAQDDGVDKIGTMRRFVFAGIVLALALATAGCMSESPPTPGVIPAAVRVASLKGPTTMGLVSLMDNAAKGTTAQPYSFTVAGTPDAVSGPLVAGQFDVALIPVNLAAVLYNKTNGGILLTAVNTLGVLYVVTGDPAVTSLADLAGKTVLNSGKGTTPQFVLDEVLTSANITVNVDYRSQPTEEASVLAATPATIAVLPEPYVTAAMAANPAVHIVADLNDAWQQATGVPLVTGCVALRTAFADANPQAVTTFMDEYAASVNFVNDNPADAAPLIVAQGLAPNAAVAQAAIPRAHIVDLTGADAKAAVSAYLNVLNQADPASVGGSIPDDSFYYNP